MTIEQKVEFFKDFVKVNSEVSTVRKFITSGETFVLTQDKYNDLKSKIADHFAIHPNEVVLVGSGKLGFSISENVQDSKIRFRHFGDKSDLDVAIISPLLFDHIWKLLLDFIDSKGYWKKQHLFTTYHFNGWMRPDMLPHTSRFDFTQEMWWKFFNTLTSSGEFGHYKISGGLYRNWHFLEKYQINSVSECKLSLL